jgi:hypothetical protein
MNAAKTLLRIFLVKMIQRYTIHSKHCNRNPAIDIKFANAIKRIQMKIQLSLEVVAFKVQTKCLSQFKYSFALCSLY